MALNFRFLCPLAIITTVSLLCEIIRFMSIVDNLIVGLKTGTDILMIALVAAMSARSDVILTVCWGIPNQGCFRLWWVCLLEVPYNLEESRGRCGENIKRIPDVKGRD
jgi:hypothetical protein